MDNAERELLARIQELGPFQTEDGARKALFATLGVLSEHLTSEERAFLAAELPPAAAHVLRSHPNLPVRGLREFFHRVARREGARPGVGAEHAEVVCRSIAESLSVETRERLRRHLPELAKLFEIPEQPEAPDHEAHREVGAPTDLAEGRVGGRHPIATADTSSLAHRNSVARSDDPHAESRLSSALGLTQEREARTLATGAPGSKNPISTKH